MVLGFIHKTEIVSAFLQLHPTKLKAATLEKLNSDEYIDQQITDILGDDVADKENKE